MKVIVAGTWRTGTTAVYNIVRLMLEADRLTLAGFSSEFLLESKPENRAGGHVLIKCHKFTEKESDWADKIIVTHRDVQDTLMSMARFGASGGKGNAANTANILRGMEHWGKWMHKADHVVEFNQIRRAPGRIIKALSDVLFIFPDVQDIEDKFRNLQAPATGIDKVTLLHHNHITKL